jgi:short-subunit dehydrogenase
MLVNNAGIALQGGLLESTAAQLQALIALNVTAPTVLAAAAAKAFAPRRHDRQHRLRPGRRTGDDGRRL